jgi:hypothetical protein
MPNLDIKDLAKAIWCDPDIFSFQDLARLSPREALQLWMEIGIIKLRSAAVNV